jgi:hypothetical protein
MTPATTYANAPDVSVDDYLVVGLATCFIREEGQVQELQVVEPIPSAALETLMKGIPTSYALAGAVKIGEVITHDSLQLPANFSPAAQFCEDFESRAIAAARTYRMHPAAQSYIPLGSTYRDFNYSTERKRVLNASRLVKAEDNVKQHAYTHQVL